MFIMISPVITLLVAASVALAAPSPAVEHVQKRSVAGSATVNLNVNTGNIMHRASGFIYGIPDTANQIPDHFYTDIAFQYGRAGGAQVASPGRGWIWGLTEYKNRFASALSNYKTVRQHGGQFIFLIHDLWGADGTQNSSAAYPGDNGNWASWDAYLNQWISDMKANGATDGLVIDIWNEPDLTGFWNRPQSQWIDMWGRTYYKLRTSFPSVLITGPSLAYFPDSTNTWWTNFMSYIKTNGSVPDQYSWHMEGGAFDMQTGVTALNGLLTTAGLPTNKQININEYGTYAEQVPQGGAWWISQLERVNAWGLRGNWLSSTSLHDFMAGLLGKPNAGTTSYSATATGYYPSPEFNVYKYYGTNMTGYRVQTLPTPDFNGDVYATVGTDKVRMLVGARVTTGTWAIQLNGLTSLGFPAAGSLNIKTWAFYGSSNHFLEEDTPTNLGIVAHTYTGGALNFPVFQTDAYTAYAFEFSVVGATCTL